MTELILFFAMIVVVSTFFSMSEVAILTINPVKLKSLADKKPYLKFFAENKSKVSSDFLVANYLFDFASAMWLSLTIAALFPDDKVMAFGASIACALITLYIATLAAKLYSANYADSVLNVLGRMIILVYWLLKPAVVLLSAPALFFLRNVLKDSDSSKLSNSEVLGVLAIAKNEGVIEARQHTLIKHLMTLQTKSVKEIMPRDQVIESVDIEADILSMGEKLFKRGHKRIVVTKTFEDKAYPVGILLFSEIARVNLEVSQKRLNGDEISAIPSVASLMHPCVVTQEDTNAMVLIEKLDKDDHIVIAVNADGQMTGVLQSDDIIRVLTQGEKSETPTP